MGSIFVLPALFLATMVLPLLVVIVTSFLDGTYGKSNDRSYHNPQLAV
jgi:ABC-type spermidine/putrescine transport system permease subunit II